MPSCFRDWKLCPLGFVGGDAYDASLSCPAGKIQRLVLHATVETAGALQGYGLKI